MKPYSNADHLNVDLYLFYCILGARASPQILQIMGLDIQKVIKSAKLHISHQLKPYSDAKPN